MRLDASSKMAEARRVDTSSVQVCDELSACPMVYQLGDSGPHYLGEVLRNIRGKASYAQQGLTLGTLPVKFLDIRLAEEKPEVSFIDELYLSVAGQTIYASAHGHCGPCQPGPHGKALTCYHGLDRIFSAPHT